MSREADLGAALADHVRQQIEAAERDANEQTFNAVRAGALHGSAHLRSLATAYRDAMRGLAELTGRLLAAIEGAAAGNRADLLNDLLRTGATCLFDGYRRRTKGMEAFSIADEVARQGAWLESELAAIVTGTVRNLRLGVVGSEPLREVQRHALQIDARGGNANVLMNSPGGSVLIGRDQSPLLASTSPPWWRC